MPLEDKIDSGKFVVLGEFEPPKGADFAPLLKHAAATRGRLDALVVPEMGNAVLKASSLGGCAVFESEGLETVLQVCCRDRNRLALQADLLAAAALGIRNVMAVPGTDIRFGDHPHARVVNDLDLMELLKALATLQQGKDLAGIELRGTPRFCVGSVIDTGASGGLLDMEIERLREMIDLGVRFVITNPVFEIRRFQQILRRIDTEKIAVIPTVLLLKSAGMARYIDRNVRGISIPPEVIRDIQKASDRVRECVRIAAGLVSRLKELGMAGVMIATAGWEDKLPEILDGARI